MGAPHTHTSTQPPRPLGAAHFCQERVCQAALTKPRSQFPGGVDFTFRLRGAPSSLWTFPSLLSTLCNAGRSAGGLGCGLPIRTAVQSDEFLPCKQLAPPRAFAARLGIASFRGSPNSLTHSHTPKSSQPIALPACWNRRAVAGVVRDPAQTGTADCWANRTTNLVNPAHVPY